MNEIINSNELKKITEENENRIIQEFPNKHKRYMEYIELILKETSSQGDYSVIIPVPKRWRNTLMKYLERMGYKVSADDSNISHPKIIVRWI